MRIIIVIKLFDVFKARELNFLNGVISSVINFSLFKILEKDLSDGIIIRCSDLQNIDFSNLYFGGLFLWSNIP